LILVDPLRKYRHAPHGLLWWCHMHSDESLAELHSFALAIGMRTEWFQPKPYAHYDLPLFRRRIALRNGAIEVGAKEALQRNFDYRLKHGGVW
jgi:hypothetical protein